MLNENSRELQSKLGKFTRDGIEEIDQELVRKERLHHYRRLVRNIADGALQSAYPIARKIIAGEDWDVLVDDFMKNHDSNEPQVWKYPHELIKYFESSNYHNAVLKKVFLLDLLKFEWMEMEVHSMEDEELIKGGEARGEKQINLNPHYKIEHFKYPVHKKHYKEIENNEADYFVMCYRKIDDLEVRYIELSPIDTIILEKLSEKVYRNELKDYILEMLNDTEENINNYLNNFIKNLSEKGMIV